MLLSSSLTNLIYNSKPANSAGSISNCSSIVVKSSVLEHAFLFNDEILS